MANRARESVAEQARDDLGEAVEKARDGRQGRVYTRRTRREALAAFLTEYRWFALALGALLLMALVAALHFGVFGGLYDASPPELGSLLWYGIVGMLASALPGYLLAERWRSVSAVGVLDLDPVTSEHRHLHVGADLWNDLRVLSPWGSEVGSEELQKSTINGVSGYELMDLRIEDGQPVAVATWMGESDAATLRTYKYAVSYARQRLAKQAERAIAMEASREAIVREVAERVVTHMIRTAERSGLPAGEQIEGVVGEVMRDMGVSDPLTDDDLASNLPDDLASEVEEIGSDPEPETNGHDMSEAAEIMASSSYPEESQ